MISRFLPTFHYPLRDVLFNVLTCTRTRLQSWALTRDLATHLAAQAADLSTLEKSLPEKAPPPWAPQPPYVSTMIFLPVRPASLYNTKHTTYKFTLPTVQKQLLFKSYSGNTEFRVVYCESLLALVCSMCDYNRSARYEIHLFVNFIYQIQEKTSKCSFLLFN